MESWAFIHFVDDKICIHTKRLLQNCVPELILNIYQSTFGLIYTGFSCSDFELSTSEFNLTYYFK